MTASSSATETLNPIVTIEHFSLTDPLALDPKALFPSRYHQGAEKNNAIKDYSEREVHKDCIQYWKNLSDEIKKAAATIKKNNAPPERVNIKDVLEANQSCFYYFNERVKEKGAVDNTNAFVIVGLLTRSESEYIIHSAFPHMTSLDALYAQRTRKADRAMIRSPTVANQLYRRILPHLQKSDYTDRTPLCFGQDGVWVPLGLNECLKVFRYNPGGVFVEHRDGPWVPRQDQCSMYTVVIYLNDNFDGGETRLLGSAEEFAPKGYREMLWNTNLGVTPVTGMALLVNHDCWHVGSPVKEGTKWILRTELIFQRVYSFYVDKNSFATSEDYLATRALYDASMKASEEGNKDYFFTSYQEVVRRQREAMLNEDTAKKPRLLSRLSLEELSVILSFLFGPDIGSLLRLNRRTYMAVVQAPYWHDLWEANAKAIGPTIPRFMHTHEQKLLSSLLWFQERLYKSKPQEHSNELHAAHSDYFGLVRRQLWHKSQFVPTGLILLDSGPIMTVPRERPAVFLNNHIYKRNPRPRFCDIIPFLDEEPANGLIGNGVSESRYQLFKASKYYGTDPHAGRYHMNRPTGEMYGTTPEEKRFGDKKPIVASGEVEWSVLTVLIEKQIVPTESLIIVVAHPKWFEDTSGPLIKAQSALDALFGLSRAAAVGFCHPAVCAVIGFLSTNLEVASSRDSLVIEMWYDVKMEEMLTAFDFEDSQEFDDYITKKMKESADKGNNIFRYNVSIKDFQVTQIRTEEKTPSDLVLVECPPTVWQYHFLGVRHELSKPSAVKNVTLESAKQKCLPGQHVCDLVQVLAVGLEVLMASPHLTEAVTFHSTA